MPVIYSRAMQFSTDAVRDLARLLNETGLHEIALQTQDENASSRIVVRAAAVPNPLKYDRRAPLSPPIPDSENSGDAQISIPSEEPEEVAENARTFAAVRATAVGLFRLAATPVQIGDAVRQGQVVGSVESLKIPTDVFAPAGGHITEIVAEEGQGVEYGQTLLIIEVDD